MSKDNFLLIKFGNEQDALLAIKALDSQHALRHHKGIACSAVLKKNEDGKIIALDKYSAKKVDIIHDVKEADINAEVALGSALCTDLGSFSWLISTISGTIKNFISEVGAVVIEEKFIEMAKQHLKEDNVVVVAHAIEDDFTIIDNLMMQHNGEITRTPVN